MENKTIESEVVKKSKKRRYTCEFCNKVFDFNCRLNMHRRIHTGEKPFSCELCLKTFASVAARNVHRKLHFGEKLTDDSFGRDLKFACEFCPKKFDFKCRLDVHRRIHTGEKPYSCEICDRQFLDKRILNVHKKTKHSLLKSHKCKTCKKVFSFERQLLIHSQVHSELRCFICEFCLQQFSRLESLDIHKSSHKGDEPYQCDICFKKYKSEDELNLHRANHAPNYEHSINSSLIKKSRIKKSYTCEFCSKSFSVQSRLKLHRTVHTRPYECEICSRKFARRYVLRRHLRSHGIKCIIHFNGSERTYSCEQCSQIMSIQKLYEHQKLHSNGDKLELEQNNENVTDISNGNISTETFKDFYDGGSDEDKLSNDDHELNENLAISEDDTSSIECNLVISEESECNKYDDSVNKKQILNSVSTVSPYSDIDFKSCNPDDKRYAIGKYSVDKITACNKLETSKISEVKNGEIKFEKLSIFKENKFNQEKVCTTKQSVIIEHLKPVYQCKLCKKIFDFSSEMKNHKKCNENTFMSKSTTKNKIIISPANFSSKNEITDLEMKERNCVLQSQTLSHKNYLIENKNDNEDFCSMNNNQKNCKIIENKNKVNNETLLHHDPDKTNNDFINYEEINFRKLSHIWHTSSTDIKSDISRKTLKPCDLLALKTKLDKNKESGNLYPCISCDQTFLLHDDFIKHYELHIHEKLNVPVSKHVTKNKSTSSAKIGKVMYRCSMCKKYFNSQRTRKNHKQMHILDKLVFTKLRKSQDYNLCNMVFRKDIFHKRKQQNKKRIFCDMCHKLVLKKWNLNIHKLIHLKNDSYQQYECEFCGRTFSWISILNMHRRIHTNKNVFSHNVFRRFKTRDHMYFHRKSNFCKNNHVK